MGDVKKKRKRKIEITPELYREYLRGLQIQRGGGAPTGLVSNLASERVPFPRYTDLTPIIDRSDRLYQTNIIGRGQVMREHERQRLLRLEGLLEDYHLRRFGG